MADNSVLPNAWGGSTSVPAAITGIKCANNFKKKIVCLHGGGETSSSFRNQSGMQNLISELGDNYEFIFLDGPENGNLWIRDPPGGKDNPTTDENWAQTSVNYINSQLTEDNYYALLGYSQGGAMSIVYLSNVNINKFNKIIFFSGYLQ